MCYSKSALPLWLAFSASIEAGEFINLGFDEPDLSGRLVPLAVGGPYVGLTAQLLPGWTVTADGKVVTETTYSPGNLGSGVGIIDIQEWRPESHFGYYLVLAANDYNDGKLGPDVWLSQTGTVPKDAAGLWVVGGGGVEGYINGRKIGLIDPVSGEWTIWNMEAYQGKDVTLQIHVRPGEIKSFDIIGFTTVPEPSEFTMLGLGLGVIGWQAWKRQRAHLSPSRNGGGRGSTHAPPTPHLRLRTPCEGPAANSPNPSFPANAPEIRARSR